MSFTPHPYLFSDEFADLPTAELPVRHHFHISKAERDREFRDAMMAQSRAIMLACGFMVLAFAVTFAAVRVHHIEQQLEQRARV